MENITVSREIAVAAFADRLHAEKAIQELKTFGFNNDEIGLALRDRTEANALIEEVGLDESNAVGTKAGLLSGGVLGGLAGLLVGIGALAIPGVGPIVAGGILFETLGSAVLGAGIGAISGGFLGALIDLGVTEEEALYYDTSLREGKTIISVRAGSRFVDALRILHNCGGDINTQKVFIA